VRRLLLAVASLLAAGAAAQPAPLAVSIVKPAAGTPVFGEVEVVAAVTGAGPDTSVEFVVDGRPAGSVSRPPYRTIVDVGLDNLPHRFEAIARSAAGARAAATVSTPAFQVDEEVSVTLHQVYVTATRDGEAVQDLGLADFSVRDDGAQQRIVTFGRGDLPFTAVLLVDASASMRGEKLAAALRGARAFAAGMRPLDEAKLVVFSDGVRAASPFTGFVEVLTAGLQRVSAMGGTAIGDMLFLAVRRLQDRQGRGAVVILSDGVDTHSALPMRLVVPEALRSQALVYLIDTAKIGDRARAGSGGEPTSPWRDSRAYRIEAELLARLLADSGGRRLDLRSVDEVEAAFRGVVEELRNHYVLGYYPKARRGDGSWHRLQVEVRRPGVAVRCAGGYVER
jgi:VWFA-related protein